MATSERTIRVGFYLSSTDPFWILVGEAATRAAEFMQIDLLPLLREEAEPSVEEQMVLVEEVMAQELDVLVIDHLHRSIARTLLDRGTPIIFTIESDFSHPLAVSPIGLYECAAMLGRYLAGKLDGRGRVLVVGGMMSGWDYGQSRIRGMEEALRDHPGMSIIHIPAPWESDQVHAYLAEAMADLAEPVDAVFGLSDTLAVAAQEVGAQMGCVGAGTLVVGINGDPLALAAIQAGTMTATVETSAADFGSRLIALAVKATGGEPLPDHFPYKTRLITADNVAEAAVGKIVAMARIPDRLLGVNRLLEAQRLRQLETSLSLNRRIGSLLDRQQLRHELANTIRAGYDYDHFQIFLWSSTRQEFILDRMGEQAETQIHVPLAESGLLGHTLLANKPTFIPDMHHSQRFPPDTYWPATRSRVILPIRQGEKIVGLLDLHSERATQHTRHELIGLQALADQLGVAMRNVQLYRQAQDATAEAKRANELKTRLLANISHELRTPLNVILGYSQDMLLEAGAGRTAIPAPRLRDIRHIYRSAEHLVQSISDLLDVSRAEVGELDIFPEYIAPRTFLEEAFRAFTGGRGAKRTVEWRLTLPRRLPLIQADPRRLYQILYNLLENAARFTEAGEIVLGAEKGRDELHLWVADTGCGISPEQQARIFQAFSTAESAESTRRGMGLGLHIVQQLVSLHRGRLALESEAGAGSIFHVYLPLPDAEPEPEAIIVQTPAGGMAARPEFDAQPASEPFLPAHLSPLLREAATYIHRNYGRALRRGEIAEHVGVTENYLTRVFREELGVTLWDYVTEHRIKQAKELLRYSARSMAEIAELVGYSNAAYFSRVFRRATGESPKQYRKNSQRK